MRVEVFAAYTRPWTLGFTRTNVEEAELVPHESAYVGFNWSHAIVRAVAVKTHAFGEADGGTNEGRMATGHFGTAAADLDVSVSERHIR